MSLPLPHTAEGLVREARASNQGKSSSSKGKNAPKDFTKVKNKVGKKKKEKSKKEDGDVKSEDESDGKYFGVNYDECKRNITAVHAHVSRHAFEV